MWEMYQCWKQYETKEFELLLCQYLKNKIYNIRLIPLDNVTNIFSDFLNPEFIEYIKLSTVQ